MIPHFFAGFRILRIGGGCFGDSMAKGTPLCISIFTCDSPGFLHGQKGEDIGSSLLVMQGLDSTASEDGSGSSLDPAMCSQYCSIPRCVSSLLIQH